MSYGTDVAKTTTKSGLETVDELVHTEQRPARHGAPECRHWASGHDGAKLMRDRSPSTAKSRRI